MREASKAMLRRFNKDHILKTTYEKVFSGKGIDIGCGDDPCNREVKVPVELVPFDLDHGDANKLDEYFAPESFDFIHSSHSLEHMVKHPWETIETWAKVLKPGGWICITVPDFMMYEKGLWPSRFNGDHKWAFHTNAIEYLNIVVDMSTCRQALQNIGFDHTSIYINRITDGWDPADPRDQTYIFENKVECAWEIVAQKIDPSKIKEPEPVVINVQEVKTKKPRVTKKKTAE